MPLCDTFEAVEVRPVVDPHDFVIAAIVLLHAAADHSSAPADHETWNTTAVALPTPTIAIAVSMRSVESIVWLCSEAVHCGGSSSPATIVGSRLSSSSRPVSRLLVSSSGLSRLSSDW